MSASICPNFFLEKNRGFAFIEFEEIEDAEQAMDNFDESELFGSVSLTFHFLGKIVKVKPAKPYKPKSFFNKPIWQTEEW